MGMRSLATMTVFALLALGSLACEVQEDTDAGKKPTGRDAGPRDSGKRDAEPDASAPDAEEALDAAPYDRRVLQVDGTVQPPSGVVVTARCGERTPVTARPNTSGIYSITMNVEGCDRMVIEYTRESYMPAIRIIDLPPPASPLTLDVNLVELSMIVCGNTWCNSELVGGVRDENFDVARGWSVYLTGSKALNFSPGEMKDDSNNPILLFGFAYLQLFDRLGNIIQQLPARRRVMIPIKGNDELLNIGDNDRYTDDPTDLIEMNWYKFDPTRGNWVSTSTKAELFYQWPCGEYPVGRTVFGLRASENASPVFWVEASRSAPIGDELLDIRAGRLRPCEDETKAVSSYRVTAPVDGSGYFAWGISLQKKACFKLTVKDSCNHPIPGMGWTSKGRFQPYRVDTYTGVDGTACIESMASEQLCTTEEVNDTCDNNYNGLGGERFWLNMSMKKKNVTGKTITNLEIPRTSTAAPYSCARSSRCVQITHVVAAPNCH